MKIKNFLGMGLIFCSLLSYGYNLENINKINVEQYELLEKEKIRLLEELVNLREKMNEKEETIEKLKKDAQIRWHRDEYLKILNKYENFYEDLEKIIVDRETKIIELDKLLKKLGQ